MTHNTYRADLVDALRDSDGIVITDPRAYTVPCGMNSILELNSKPIKVSSVLKAADHPDRVVIMSAWAGVNGSQYTGKYVVTSVI